MFSFHHAQSIHIVCKRTSYLYLQIVTAELPVTRELQNEKNKKDHELPWIQLSQNQNQNTKYSAWVQKWVEQRIGNIIME